MALNELIRHSVTRDEVESGYVSRFWISPLASSPMVNLPPSLPAYWSPQRDVVLRDAYRRGGQWASAVNIAVTKVSVQGYELSGDVALRVRRAREMLGALWIDVMERLTRDFVTCDNGSFLEVVRATKSYASRVLGFIYLSSARCVRTNDAEYPVLYIDALGHYHEMRSHQVADFSDMPDDDLFGVGLSATSRAYEDIYEDAAVRAYFREKATGRRPLSLYFMSGMAQNKIDQALESAHEDANRKGILSYMGAAVIGNPNDVPLNLVTVPLASLPDGFNQQQHEELMQIRFANALGLDPVELNPRLIGNRALGAGSQAQVLDDKQESKGLISLRQKIAAFLNDTDIWHPLPGGVTFAWSERDLKDQQAKASIESTRAATSKTRVESGITTAAEEKQVLVDAGDLPEDFIQVDTTEEEVLTDEDKADEGSVTAETPSVAEVAPGSSVFETPVPIPAIAAPQLAEAKEASDVADLMAEQYTDAQRLARVILRSNDGNPPTPATAREPVEA